MARDDPLGFSHGEKVDRAAFTVLGVRELDDRLPAVGPVDRSGRFDELGVALVQEPVELSTAPAHDAFVASIESLEGPMKERDREGIAMASLQPGDGRLVAADPSREIPLPPAKAPAEEPADPPDANVVHRS